MNKTIAVFFFILLPNLAYLHLIGHHYDLFAHQQTANCGVEVFYIIPYFVFIGVFALYKIYKIGFNSMVEIYQSYFFYIAIGLALFFIIGQLSYFDFYYD